MQNNDKFQTEILFKLKEMKLKQFKGYRLDSLLYNNVGRALGISKLDTLFRSIKKVLFNPVSIEIKNKRENLLFLSYNYHRLDHFNAWEKFKNLFSNYDEIIVEEKFSLKQLVSVHVFIQSLYFYCLFSYKMFLEKIGNERHILAADLVMLRRLSIIFAKTEFTNKVYISFFDGNCIENLITQIMKQKGMKTVTLQHGQPVFHGFSKDFLNQTCLLNFTSDYVIVPGEFAKKQYVLAGISSDKIKVLGSLRKICKFEYKKNNEFVVFFDCPTYSFANNVNKKMTKFAENISREYGLRYYIKIHPQDNIENYNNLTLQYGEFIGSKMTTINELIKNASFSMLHFSGVYLDILAMGKKSFVLDNNQKYFLAEGELENYSTYEQLLNNIKKWNDYSILKKYEYINEIMEYYLSPFNSGERHKVFVTSLIVK